MNTPNPLVPQGTMPSGKSTLRIAVFTILVIHVALIGGFLIQGCKPNKPAEVAAVEPTNNFEAGTNDAMAPLNSSSAPVDAVSNTTVAQPASVVPVVPPPVIPQQPVAVAATAGTTEYVIAKGDLLATVAKKHGVTLKALMDANPGVDPKKLKLGQKIQIPAASSAPAVSASAASGVEAVASSEGTLYTVKAGDALAKIAKAHNTSVTAIVALNNLKSKTIKTGQKLKMPAPKAPAAPEAPVSASAAAAVPNTAPVIR